MDTQIVIVFCLCDDLLKTLHHYEDPQSKMRDAEVISLKRVNLWNFFSPQVHSVTPALCLSIKWISQKELG
jgi:hypothetical protein